jgi:ABC-2 type transport system permease protein
MNVVAVARKSVLELAREPMLLALAIAVPVFFMVIFTLSGNVPRLSTHPVLVMSPDLPALGPQAQVRGQPLVEALAAERYADGRPAFKITPTADRGAAEAALKDKTATALVSIHPDEAGQLGVTLRGDPTSMAFIEASALLETVANRYLKHAAGKVEAVRLVAAPLAADGPQTYSDLYSPGLIVIAILLNASLVAMLIAREIRSGTLQRLRLTHLRPWELFAGMSAVQMVLSGLEVALMFLCALALGLHNRGAPELVLGVGLILSFSAIGLGLIVACFVSNDSQAINVGGTAAMIQVFLSGAMFPLPPFTVFTFAGHEVGLFDIIPASHVVLALQQVMCYGAGWREIGFQIAMAAGLSALYFALGVIVFGRRQMRQGG